MHKFACKFSMNKQPIRTFYFKIHLFEIHNPIAFKLPKIRERNRNNSIYIEQLT